MTPETRGVITLAMNKSNSGFTLVELMLTLTIAGIVLSFGVPAFTDVIRNNRLSTQTNELIAAINMARSEAVRRGANVTLCTSTDQSSCTGASWQQGWIILDSNNQVLRIGSALHGTTTVTSSANTLTYTPRGFLNGGAAVSMVICNTTGKPGRQINITATGRPTNVSPQPGC